MTTTQLESPTHDDIAIIARNLWEEEGRPEGKAEEHWRLAETLLRQAQEAGEQTASQGAGIV